jgi:hypothetical protein
MHFSFYLMIAALVVVGLEVAYALYQLATFVLEAPMVSCDRPRLLEELARTVREVVARDFKRSPETIMLAFTLKG